MRIDKQKKRGYITYGRGEMRNVQAKMNCQKQYVYNVKQRTLYAYIYKII